MVLPGRKLSMRVRFGIASAFLALALLALLGPAKAWAEPPFEPNDSLLTAAGPLANNQTYTAALETANDQDYFYFYVTTPNTAQITFTLTNLGGGPSEYSSISAGVEDSHGSRIAEIAFEVPPADYGTKSLTLGAGKYYVHVEGDSEYGESYKLATSGTEGAFGDYALIAAQCASATVPVTTYQAQLATAKAHLKKAAAHLNRVQHARNRSVRRKARANYVRAKETVAAETSSLKHAEAGQKPWCFIPQ